MFLIHFTFVQNNLKFIFMKKWTLIWNDFILFLISHLQKHIP